MKAIREKAAKELTQALDDRFLKALADPTRIDLIRQLLTGGPCCIGDLAEKFPQDRSVISRHLRVLLDAGLMRVTKQGRQVVYDLDGPEFLRRLESILEKARNLVALCCPPDASATPLVTLQSISTGRKKK